MDGLTFIGHCIFFTCGVVVGAAIMYIGIVLIDRKFDRLEEQEENGRE